MPSIEAAHFKHTLLTRCIAERRKAERYLKKARQQLIACEDPAQVNDLKQQVHLCDVDLNYTLYYPLNEAYSSLYKKDAQDDAASLPEVNRSSPMWTVVETAMAKNQLQALREGHLLKSREKDSKVVQTRPAPSVSASKLETKKGTKTQAHKEKTSSSKPRAKATETRKAHETVEDDDDDDQTGTGFFE